MQYQVNDKYDMFFNENLLETIIKNKLYLNNLFFYSNMSNGKKTLIKLIFKHIYKQDYVLKDHDTYKSAPYHIEIIPSGLQTDKLLIKDVILPFVKQRLIEKNKNKFVIIWNINQLNLTAQSSLRRIMEKYNTIFFLIGQTIINPLISRCIVIRICAPSKRELFHLLSHITINKKNNTDKIFQIIDQSHRNVSIALWKLEFYLYNINDYTYDITYIINYITDKNMNNIIDLRQHITKLIILNHNIYNIFELILITLIKKYPNNLIYQIFSDTNKNLHLCKKQMNYYEFLIYNLKKIYDA